MNLFTYAVNNYVIIITIGGAYTQYNREFNRETLAGYRAFIHDKGRAHIVIAFTNGDAYVVIIFTIALARASLDTHPARCEDGRASI